MSLVSSGAVLKRLLVSLVSFAIAGSALVVPAVATSASAAVQVTTVTAQAGRACTYRRDGNVWRCVTPGAYCPKAAHGKYGYAKATGKRYRCTQYTKTTWRWKRA